jgi:hypothetical protein
VRLHASYSTQAAFRILGASFQPRTTPSLEMLASNPRGLTEHFLLAHGFSAEMLSSLVLANLAIVVTEPMTAHRGATFMAERIHITDAGRMSLEG